MAIIGSGDIAKALNDREGFIFFAAGVSNSSEIDENQYERERKRLMRDIEIAKSADLHFVYFSSIACFFSMTRYTVHKMEMELMIKEHCPNYTIIRIGNISWGTNPNTFINFIRNKKAKGEFYVVRDEWKYLIDKEELLFITDNLPRHGRNEISVFGDMKKVKDCI